MKKCLNCEKEIPNSSKYCSGKCQIDYQYKLYIKRWQKNEESGMRGKYSISHHIKKFIWDKYNSKCASCGWHEINITTGKIPLEIDHIDGDYKNNKEDNLILLCPNCHALTPTYRALNKKGRKERKAYNHYR